MGFEGQVSASKWLKRIGNRSLLVIEEEDGTLFIGSVRGGGNNLVIHNYGTYDPNGQFKYSLLFLCYSKKTKRKKSIPIPRVWKRINQQVKIKCDESIL